MNNKVISCFGEDGLQTFASKNGVLDIIIVAEPYPAPAPYYVNDHCEHHMFMHVPCWNLPKVHRLLKAKGVMDRMLTAPGYVTVLREASSKDLVAA